MRTHLSRVFYFLGDLVSHLLRYNLSGIIFYSLYRRLMLISISLDKNNIVWENAENKESSRYSNDKDDFAHATWSISFPPTKYNQDETEFIVNKTWIQNNFFDTLESNDMNELRGSDGH